MKWMIASDLHGSYFYASQMQQAFEREQADRLLLLGDLLYHGPRNGVPVEYDPKKVAEMLNSRGDRILAVRGNCDCDVDQMMLSFPIMSEYAQLAVDERRFFLTHGHLYHRDYLPPLPKGAVFVQGHTHIPSVETLSNGVHFLNPGSISLPKGGSPRTFALLDGGRIEILRLDDASEYASMTL